MKAEAAPCRGGARPRIATSFGIGAVFIGLLLLAACTTPSEGQTDQEVPAYTLPTPLPDEELSLEQQAALSDGVAETSEYQEGFRRYEACLGLAGYQLVDVFHDEYGFINAGIPDAAVTSGTDAICYLSEWKYVDMYWQVANADNSPSTRLLATCLEEHGIEPADTSREISIQIEEAEIDVAAC